MCNEDKNLFADLEDTEYWNEPAPAAKVSEHQEDISNLEIPGFVEDCPKCRGTGSWRLGYKCFKCKGTGKLQFKTAPEARAKARKYSQKRKVKSAEANLANGLAALDKDVREWIVNNADSNDFALSMKNGLSKYGSITDNMIAGVRKAIARDDEAAAGAAEWIENHPEEHAWLVRETENGNEFAGDLLNGKWGLMKRGLLSDGQLNAVQKNLGSSSDAPDSDLDISGLKGYYAVPEGDTRLKICVRRPGKNSKWHGWTFVDDGAAYGSRQTYGKQAPDGTYKGQIVEQLKAILENPLEAQIAYGKLTGTCGYCGRVLEDEQSVARGIGPICAAKYS